MRDWIYRWLPIIFGCHCRPERSFFFRGRQLPLCARCTGELLGILAAVGSWWLWRPSAVLALVLLVPLVVDGLVQLCTAYESRNYRRLWTGVLFRYGLTALFFLSTAWVFHQGRLLDLSWKSGLCK